MENPKSPRRSQLRKPILLITYAILLFLLIYRIDTVWNALIWLLTAIAPLFTGLILAYLFHIPMNFFQYRLLYKWEYHKIKQLRKLWPGLSMLFAYLTVLAFVFGLGVLILPRAIESVGTLMSNFSGYLKSFQAWADGALTSLAISPDMGSAASNLWEQAVLLLQALMGQVISGAFDFTVSFTSGLFNFVLAFMFSAFFLCNRRTVFGQIRRLSNVIIGEKRTKKCAQVLQLSNNIFSRFVLGKLIDSLILGVLCFLGMSLFGMEYALLISTIIAITALVPIIGSIVGTIICALLLLVIDPAQALWFVVFIVVLQQLEGNIVYPRLMGNAVGLSGLWVLVSVIIGGGLFGVWGMLLGTPLFAICYHLTAKWLDEKKAK